MKDCPAMQDSTAQSRPASSRVFPFLFYLIAGFLIYFFGANTISRFSTNSNRYFEWGLTGFLLLLAVASQRIPSLRVYTKIIAALFIASFANALNLALGNFLGQWLHKTDADFLSYALDKTSQAIPIVLGIILLSLWSGDDLGTLFLKRRNLRQGLKFGLISQLNANTLI
jgi:hypothetical protein